MGTFKERTSERPCPQPQFLVCWVRPSWKAEVAGGWGVSPWATSPPHPPQGAGADVLSARREERTLDAGVAEFILQTAGGRQQSSLRGLSTGLRTAWKEKQLFSWTSQSSGRRCGLRVCLRVLFATLSPDSGTTLHPGNTCCLHPLLGWRRRDVVMPMKCSCIREFY